MTDLQSEIAQVFQDEAAVLARTGPEVAEQIAEVARLVASEPGRVVVTGIGKSGHVARKIAATLASIGKPSYFVHATEASHGDMGNLVDGDIVLALSNSGETPELSDVIHYCRARDLPLISVTAYGQSALASFATHKVIYPPVQEVCVIGRAPTTSTTVMAVIGDALAVAITRLLGTTDDDFGRFHPGGSLGARLKLVGDIAHTGDALPVVDGDTPMHEAMIEMSQKALGVTLVRDGKGAVAGLITDGDLRRVGPGVWQKPAAEVANFAPLTVTGSTLVSEALSMMQNRKITSLVMTDGAGALTGIVHIHDCLRLGQAKLP